MQSEDLEIWIPKKILTRKLEKVGFQETTVNSMLSVAVQKDVLGVIFALEHTYNTSVCKIERPELVVLDGVAVSQ